MSRAQRGHYYGPRVHDFPYIPWTQCITCLDHCMFTKIKEFARVNSNGQKYTLQSQRNGLYRTLLRQCACLLSRYKLRKRTRHRRTILGSLSTAAGQTKPHPLHLWRRRCRPRNHRTRSDSAAPPFLYRATRARALTPYTYTQPSSPAPLLVLILGLQHLSQRTTLHKKEKMPSLKTHRKTQNTASMCGKTGVNIVVTQPPQPFLRSLLSPQQIFSFGSSDSS